MSCVAAVGFLVVAGIIVWRNRTSIVKALNKPKFPRLQQRCSVQVPRENEKDINFQDYEVYDVIDEKYMIANFNNPEF